MRLPYFALLISLLASTANADPATPHIGPQLQWLLHRPEPARAPSTGFAPLDSDAGVGSLRDSAPPVRVLVQGDPLKTAAAISLLGGKVLGYHGDTVHAELTSAQVRMLVQQAGISGIQASRKLQPSLTISRKAIHADEVQAGVNLPQPYTGKGVIIGIVDTGIDITHPDFKNPDGSTRILSVWDQTYEYSDGFRRPAGYDYGVECTAENINAANAGDVEQCLTDDGKPIDNVATEGHGTHVAGIAAGSDPTYRGIAPDASLIIVRAHFEEGSILDGVDYVFSKCQEYSRPCVINLSLGTTAGAHDGTSLIEQKLAEKTGPGRFIVAAAGNEASTVEQGAFGHAQIPFTTSSGALIKGPVIVPNPDLVRNDDFSIVIDAWSNDASNRDFYIAALTSVNESLVIHNEPSFQTPPLNGNSLNQAVTDSLGHTFGYVHLISAIDPANNRRETLIAIDRCSDDPCSVGGKIDTAVSSIASVYWVVNSRETSPAGQLDMWPINTSGFFLEAKQGLTIDWPLVGTGPHDILGGDNFSTITIPATSKDVIAVGSYITKTQFVNSAGKTVVNEGTIGALSSFSSRGPATGDVGVKPDLVAPGEWIASAHSTKESLLPKLWEENDLYVNLQGTSMASPHVTGVLALMLERNAQLTPKKVLGPTGLMTGKTQSTPFTGTLPNTDWGYGVVDASAIFQNPSFVEGTTADDTPPEIKSIKVKTSGSRATVTWVTNEPSNSEVILSASGGGSDRKGSLLSYVKGHNVIVSGLRNGTTYRVSVRSTDLSGNTATKAAGTSIDTGSCGCASRDGMNPADAIPFLLLGMGWLAVQFRKKT